ncbi:MAG: lipocalin-like domain-containing protein [Candidatus Acidiferrales bacterium]
MSNGASRTSVQDIRARLIGAWRLLSMHETLTHGKVVYPFGEDARGQLMYSAEGRMSAQLMRAKMPRFAKDDTREATPEERASAWLDYFGYFGTYLIDPERNAVIHHVEGSSFPNFNGSEQVRFFRFEGERLVLDADAAWGQMQAVWEKIASRNS